MLRTTQQAPAFAHIVCTGQNQALGFQIKRQNPQRNFSLGLQKLEHGQGGRKLVPLGVNQHQRFVFAQQVVMGVGIELVKTVLAWNRIFLSCFFPSATDQFR